MHICVGKDRMSLINSHALLSSFDPALATMNVDTLTNANMTSS